MAKDRQFAESINDIRPDHTARYAFASNMLGRKSVLDIACGCGYGSWMLYMTGNVVTGVDIDQEAIDYAKRYYEGPTYLCQKAEETKGEWDVLVTFETLEHLRDPAGLLKAVQAKQVIASVPNEERYPFRAEMFGMDDYPHQRHYTPAEFDRLFEESGYTVESRHNQGDKMGKVYPGPNGNFLIYIANRA